MDSSSWKAFGEIDPELKALFASYVQQAAEASFNNPVDLKNTYGISKSEIQIPVRDGSTIRAVVYRPMSEISGALFGAVYYHGGGFVVGTPELWEHGAVIMVQQLGCTVVNVDYRLAPEHTFPTAALDAIDALHWAAANTSSIGADASKGFIVGGTSAGGNLAAVAAHSAVDSRLEPAPTGVYLSMPLLLHHHAIPEQWKPHLNSFEQNKDAMILNRQDILWFYDQYQPKPKSHLISPLLWPSGHKGQPPTYFQICGMDPLRDDALLYEHVLHEEYGVPTKKDIYSGIPHGGTDFLIAMPTLVYKALQDAKEGVEWLLNSAV
ncbi:hypothetical protein BU23DRAFT_593382 [Bimuria novae-zelandiae CBS 107.79]|uniref:Alpha/beta hydrolase fold-3 domain-containing protein n=1 Tax=Bimuria novae-zelandiae CBS 107.79 TaxID=1447943 RepID=A0A6A5ULC7_9PLEO|nr:hypothetical protein BU23DRAFT_593382 [Bimuria novae-zelandiae CBS 107.79]